MPTVPIPDDWSGDDWECVQIQWPKSEKWLAILAGFITQPMRGRFWDERTGSIKAIQRIGELIDAANLPFVSCAGQDILIPDTAIQFYGDILCDCEDDMALCTVSAEAFQIRNGNELWVNDHCRGWIKIGSFLVGSGDVDPDNPPVDDPPEGLTSGTACAKAQKLALITHDIIDTGFNAVNLGLNDPSYFLFGWYDFADIVRQAFPTINFGDQALYELFYALYILEPLGLESETESPAIQSSVACAFYQLFEDGPAGITVDQYNAAKNVIYPAANTAAAAVVKNTAATAWQLAFASIGPNDAAKLTSNLPDVDASECACPGSGVTASSIYFTGIYDDGTTDATIESAEMKDSGRRFKLQFSMPETASYKKVFAFDAFVDGAAAGDELTVRLYPNLAAPGGEYTYYPGAIDSQPATKAVAVEDWNNIIFMADDDTGIDAVRVNYDDYVEFTSENPGGKVINRVRIAQGYVTPSDAGEYAYNRDVLEIVAVNGVRLTPIGPISA